MKKQSFLYDIENNFIFLNPSKHLSKLMEAYKIIQKLEDTHWRKIKVKQIKEIIEGCARLNLEASSIDSSGALNSLIDVNFFIIYHKIC